jgi:hypothetical protein
MYKRFTFLEIEVLTVSEFSHFFLSPILEMILRYMRTLPIGQCVTGLTDHFLSRYLCDEKIFDRKSLL